MMAAFFVLMADLSNVQMMGRVCSLVNPILCPCCLHTRAQ